MNLLFITFISSTVVSFAQILNASKMLLKRIFDEGFKIDPKRLREVNDFLHKNGQANNLHMLFVPYINLYYSVVMTKAIENLNNEVFNSLLTMGVIEKMNDYELIEYSKNPDLHTGINIENLVDDKLLASKKIVVKDGFKEGEIVYRGKEIIYKTRFLKDKTEEEILEIMRNANRDLVIDIVIKNYKSIENFCKAMETNKGDVILKLALEITSAEEYIYNVPSAEKNESLKEKENVIMNSLGEFTRVVDLTETDENQEVLILKKQK